MKPTSNTLKGKRIIGKPIHSAKGEHKMEPLIKISNDKFAETIKEKKEPIKFPSLEPSNNMDKNIIKTYYMKFPKMNTSPDKQKMNNDKMFRRPKSGAHTTMLKKIYFGNKGKPAKYVWNPIVNI